MDAKGHVHMVAIDAKAITKRSASAVAFVSCSTDALLAIATAKKGDVLATVRIAAIQAAKQTSSLIPLCHPIPLTHVAIDLDIEANGVRITARAESTDRTGVEMEALTAASVGALTFYDMLKAVDRSMTFEVGLVEKSGGQSGDFSRSPKRARARTKLSSRK